MGELSIQVDLFRHPSNGENKVTVSSKFDQERFVTVIRKTGVADTVTLDSVRIKSRFLVYVAVKTTIHDPRLRKPWKIVP